MSQTSQLQQIDPETLEDIKDLRDTREQVLREQSLEKGRDIGLEQGRDIGLELAAKRLLSRDFSPEEVAEMLSLPLDRVQALATSSPT